MTQRTEPMLRLDDANDDMQAPVEPSDKAVTVRKFRKTEARTVVLTGIKMGFWAMVWFMLKWALASIPAALILIAVFSFVPELLRGLGLALR